MNSVPASAFGHLSQRDATRGLVHACLVGAVLLTSGVLLLLGAAGFINSLRGPTTMLMLAVVLAALSFGWSLLSLRGMRFDLFQPFFHSSWFFFVPHFIVPAVIYAVFAIDTPSYFAIAQAQRSLILSLVYAVLGAVALAIGYCGPLGKKVAAVMPDLQAFHYKPDQFFWPAIVLLAVGFAAQLAAFATGYWGFQLPDEIGTMGATYAFISHAVAVSQVFIWFAVFSPDVHKRRWWYLVAASVAYTGFNVFASGSRATLLFFVTGLLASYQYTHKQLRPARLALVAVPLLAIAVLVGVVFGTVYRATKTEALGRATQMSLGDIGTLARGAMATVAEMPRDEFWSLAGSTLLWRLEGFPNLAVILEQADQMKQIERDYGIYHSIGTGIASALVPRAVWPHKPNIAPAELVGNLYFNTRLTSPSFTYMGDLYRNYGTIGVLIGMLMVGVLMRALYVWSLEGQAPSAMSAAAFLFFLQEFNLEGDITQLIPGLVRDMFVFCLVLLVIAATVRRSEVSPE